MHTIVVFDRDFGVRFFKIILNIIRYLKRTPSDKLILLHMNKFIKSLIFMFLIPISLLGQSNEGYSELKKYSNFGFTFGGSLFDKAKIEFEQGSYPVSSFATPSYNFGFYYNLPIYGKWSIQTGLYYAQEAGLSLNYKFLDEDITNIVNNEQTKVSCKEYSFSIPLSVKYKVKIGSKSYLDFKLGMRMMLLLPSSIGLTNYFLADTGYCVNLRALALSPDEFFHGSIVSGIGYSIDLNKILLGIELNRTINFQNTFSGRFRFYNLLTNPDAYGYYNLSGDYWSLNVNIHFLSKKYRKEQKTQRKKTEIQI